MIVIKKKLVVLLYSMGPVVSGNVSLYNETNNEAILPTPVIGCVGLMEDIEKSITLDFKATEESIFVIGKTYGWLGCSVYQKLFSSISDVRPPPVDLIKEKKNGEFVRFLIDNHLLTSCHDISDGGIGVADGDSECVAEAVSV